MTRWSAICALLLVPVAVAAAEVRAIRASGEYRMGDNDTRAEGKRLALADAKRRALEQVGTYVESISEVRDMKLGRDEIRAYTAGIVEVKEAIEHTALDADGKSMVISVEVVCDIDPAVLTKQIENLRRNEAAGQQLQQLRAENDALRRRLAEQSRSVAEARTPDDAQRLSRQRDTTLTNLEVGDLLARAWVALGSEQGTVLAGASTPAGRGRARPLVLQALTLDPDSAPAHQAMGGLLYEEGNWDGALAEFREALRLQPRSAAAHGGLGNALQSKGALTDAIREYRRALALNPDSVLAHNNLGSALLAKGDAEGAARQMREVIRRKPNFAPAHVNLGIALKVKGDLAGAVSAHRRALALKPDYAEAHYNLGIALEASGAVNEAIGAYREALRLAPDHADAHNNLGIALASTGDWTGAIDEFRRALRLKPDHPNAHYGLGVALENTKELDAAAHAYRQALRVRPHFASAHYQLAGVLKANGDVAGAIAEFRAYLRDTADGEAEKHRVRAIVRELGGTP
ncbi:MAG: tetratricopeptide repeat protein [Deltaproteobacteria bacterium]|nr:tetratricopeptide repeat protein [Deltaproteobacteria bacterium]